MVLVKVIECLMALGKPCDDFVQGCFTSLMEASIQLKEMEEEDEEEEDDEEAENDEEFDDETEDDDEV